MLHHFAYIDAGTGSLFIQTIIGGLLAAGVVLRRYIGRAMYKVKNALSRTEKVDDEA